MKVGVISDDLTGTNGTGVLLAKLGLMAVTIFNTEQLDEFMDNTAVGVDTDSRYILPEEAKQRITKTVRDFGNWNVDILCKRIDSTFRGNIGQEIDGILESNQNAVGIVVPTYPDLKRITVGGYLLINDIPLQETDVKDDPIRPLSKSYLPYLLKRQTKSKIGLIQLDKVCQGFESIRQEICRKAEKGYRIIICDAITGDHIREIAKAMAEVKNYMLFPADPGPLTSCYIGECIRKAGISFDAPDAETAPSKKSGYTYDRKVLAVIGSVTSLTQKQLQHLVNEMGVMPIRVDPGRLISNLEKNHEIGRVVAEGLRNADNASVVLITTCGEAGTKLDLKRISMEEGSTADKIADRITEGLGEISYQILKGSGNHIKRCFFSGGDVTAAFCKAAKVEGIRLMDEVMPLIAHGRVSGKIFNGVHLVTKGGLVGKEASIYDCITYLQSLK